MEITLDIGYPSNLLYSDVSISVPDHGIISFVGDNGCGKSTLLKTLAGIINPMRGVVPSELLNMNFMVSNYISIPEEVKVKDIMLLLGNENCNYVKNKYGNIYQFKRNLLYLYFFSFTIKNIELQNEKNELYRKLKIAQNNYNNTFDFLHALIHDSHSIDMYFKNKEYEKAENDFYVMKQEIIEKFNIIYTGNTALSTAICNINLGNTTIQHFVQCNTKEFNDSDLTIFFINILNNLIEDNEPIIYVSIVNIGLNKAISIKTNLAHDFSTVERDNHRFIKKYNLKVDKEEKKITFLHLNPK